MKHSTQEEVAGSSGGRSFFRIVVAVGLTVFVLGSTLPNLISGAVALPFGTDANMQVNAVYNPSAAPGLRVGDAIDWRACSLWQRLALFGSIYPEPGTTSSFPIVRKGRHFTTTVTANAEASNVWLTFIKRGSATAFVLTALVLLLRRPSRMLWGFFLYAIGSVNGDPLFFDFLPIQVYAVAALALQLLSSVGGPIGLWIFASRFPQDRSSGWRALADRAALPAAIVLTILLFVTALLPMYDGQPPAPFWTVPSVVALTVGLLCFFDAFAHLRAGERQRLKWVTLGLSVYYVAWGYQLFSTFLPSGGWPLAWSNAGWSIDVLSGVQILIPITVSYAVLRHRVIDVNFVVSRALVYGVVTTLVIGVFALIDWFFAKALAERQIAAVVEIFTALAFGFSLNAMHRFVDNIVDRVLFRRRHLAEKRLARAAAGVHHVTSPSAIDETLTSEPVEALALASAAVFRRVPDGTFVRMNSIGWNGETAKVMTPDDSLVQNLHGERGVIRLREVRKPGSAMPEGAAAPALAVPLFVRHTLDGFILFGPHVGGEDFDPEEIGLLEHLAISAASTYDHLEAESARIEAERLARELNEARRLIVSLRTARA